MGKTSIRYGKKAYKKSEFKSLNGLRKKAGAKYYKDFIEPPIDWRKGKGIFAQIEEQHVDGPIGTTLTMDDICNMMEMLESKSIIHKNQTIIN